MRRGPLVSVLVLAAAAAGAWEAGRPEWAIPPEGGPDVEAGERLLRAHVAGAWDAELRWSDFRESQAEVDRFYARRGWTLAWLPDGRPTDAAWRLAEALAAAARKGLDPLDYGVETLEPRLAAADRGEASPAERIRLDVALTVSALRFARDLAQGRILPLPETRLLGRPQIARSAGPPPDLALLLEAAAGAVDPGAVLASVEPDWPAYRRTLAELDAWLVRARAAPAPPLPPAGAERVAPEVYARPELLSARLRELGDLAPWDEAEGGCREEAAACRSPLAEALARFQRRHGLAATGLVDAATLRELDAPPARRAAQLALALERWRWFPRRPPAPWIVVNVPEFALHAGDREEELTMRVVVGQAWEWGTPLLAASVTQVVFRPAWSVPLSIQQQELAARVEADGAFVAAGGFEVLDEAERPVAGATGRDLAAGLRSGALRLRQRPGAGNTLGLVKIALSGPSWLYLHGTPSEELFGPARRDFSHGCIRVEDPEGLAVWILRGEAGWTPRAVRAAARGSRTVEVPVSREITVLVAYFTASGWGEGGFTFREDVYGQDAALATALREEALRRGAEPP